MATDTGEGDPDVDPAELQAQLDRIQEAMGITERSEGATRQWLVLAGLVGVASLASQYVYSADLSAWLYWFIWFGGFGGGSALYYGWYEDVEFETPADKPSIPFQIFVPYLAVFPVLAVLGYAADLGERAGTLTTFAVIVIMLGVGYAVAGHSLRAYRIRARDRYPFYVGGVWMAALGVAVPRYELLRAWPYLAFGGIYVAYALLTYAYLER
ncbi:MAG: hypothetical protein ACI9YT_003087 [Halobacteriales archaeon]|jgi:hypothetical protein